MRLLERLVRQHSLAPYLLVLAPALLLLQIGEAARPGISGQYALLMTGAYLAFGAVTLWLGRAWLGATALLTGLLLMAIVEIEHDPGPVAAAGKPPIILLNDMPPGNAPEDK